MNWTKFLSVLLVVAFANNPFSVIAQPKLSAPLSEAETLAQVAKEQFTLKNFPLAADLFMKAYAKSHAPAMVYNAARAYEEVGNKAAAVATFKLYCTLSTDSDGTKDAQNRLVQLEAVQPVVVEPVTKSVVVVQPPVAQVPQKNVQGVEKTTTPQPNQAKSNVLAWATTGGSVVAIGTGVALLLIGKNGSEQAVTQQNRSAWNSSRSEWITGAVLTGAGVVLGGISTYLWVSSKPVSVVPTTNGVVVGGNF